jgi:hypothetical protein
MFLRGDKIQSPSHKSLPNKIHGPSPNWQNLTPFDTNWKEGSGATPLETQGLFFGDAISIPTAPTNHLPDYSGLRKNASGQKGAASLDQLRFVR